MALTASWRRNEGMNACASKPVVRAAAANGEGFENSRARPSEYAIVPRWSGARHSL